MMESILKNSSRNSGAPGVAARLYRFTAVTALSALLALPAATQLRTTKPAKGPRAIAVVRWQPNAQGKAVPRLLPVVILQDGKYYDASLFRATPRPMALDPGVVYEAQDKGDLLGYFTVQNASRNATTRQWVGLGEWQAATRSSTELELRERPQTAEVVKEGQRGTSPIFTDSVDDRETNSKKSTTVYDEEGREIPAGQATDDKPPTLKRKEGDIERSPRVAPPKKEAPAPISSDDDPDRPRLKRGGQVATADSAGKSAGAGRPSPATTSTSSPTDTAVPKAKSEDDDPNRPILRRGGGSQQKTGTSETSQSAGTAVPGRVQARGDVTAPYGKDTSGFATRTFEAVAVSDAAEVAFRDDYRFKWTDAEREEVTAKMRKLAQAEVDRFLTAAITPSSKSGAASTTKAKATTARASAAGLTEVEVAGLDLEANNSAELVLTGRAIQESGKVIFLTLVARTDVDGNPRKLFSAVTMSDRLDVVPRLELVDAVDVDGDRRGELLFRRIRDHSAEFVIYRVDPDKLTELFHGGNAD